MINYESVSITFGGGVFLREIVLSLRIETSLLKWYYYTIYSLRSWLLLI